MWQKAAADKGHKYIHQTQTETFLQGKEGLLGILFICQVPVLNRYFLLSCTFFRKRFPGGNCSLSVTVASYMWALKHSDMKFSQRISANLGFPQLNRATGCDAWGMKFSEGEMLLCRDNRTDKQVLAHLRKTNRFKGGLRMNTVRTEYAQSYILRRWLQRG